MRRRGFLAGLLLAGLAADVWSAPADDTLVVFAAASLTEALEEIGRDFTARVGGKVAFSFGASSDLARQIRAGAPADVFVSADLARMTELEAVGLVRPRDRVTLLSNRLVVIAPAGSRLAMAAPSDLARAHRLALADPDAVPAGVYARQWLLTRGLWTSLRDRVVPTLDVRAALATVASGAADAGVVYRTDARLSQRVHVVFEVPPADAPPILYPAAVLARSTKPGARAFVETLTSPRARAVFERLGFLAPRG